MQGAKAALHKITMFGDKRIKLKPDELAALLMKHFVESPINKIPEQMQAPAEVIAAFDAKTRLYQFATVLMAVMNEEQSDRHFCPVRTELERLFLPPTFQQGGNMLDELRSAMMDLSNLMTPREKPHHLSWARDWFASTGLDESNPETLSYFSIRWLDYFATICKAIKTFKPRQ